MKKILTVVLMVVFVMSSAMTAFAAPATLSLDKAGLGRGVDATDAQVKNNADGSLFANGVNVSFYLPEVVNASETVTVHVKGTSAGDFRMWLIDTPETTNSNQYKMSENGFETGKFDVTVELTATAPATELFFKAAAWDSTIDNLVIESLTVDYGRDLAAVGDAATVTVTSDVEEEGTVEIEELDDEEIDDYEEEDGTVEEVEEDEEDEEDEEVVVATPAKTATKPATSLPKTGEASTFVLWGAIAAAALVGLFLSKKKVATK